MMKFNEIYVKHYNEVLEYVNYKINDRVNAEELTNNVFLKVNNHLAEYDEKKSAFKTWLFTITNRTIIDYYRTNHSNRYVNVSNFVDSETSKELFQFIDTNEASSNLENDELSTKIAQSFDTLKPNYRKIAELYFLKEKKYNEIAQICEIPLGTVKGMINRVREKLQNELKGQLMTV